MSSSRRPPLACEIVGLKTEAKPKKRAPRRPSARGLSTRALSTPEPSVRIFSRRVQPEGALDLTQGDYKNVGGVTSRRHGR
jgi:hypothetical protein